MLGRRTEQNGGLLICARLRFHKVGSLDELKVEELPRPIPAAGEVLIQVKAAAINPSDVKNVQGKMHETSLPRIPGRDFAGIVVEGPGDLSGQLVFGSGGNLGFGRDGNHAEFVAVPASAVLPLPKNLSFEQPPESAWLTSPRGRRL
jgi:NADPH:quinone reductase